MAEQDIQTNLPVEIEKKKSLSINVLVIFLIIAIIVSGSGLILWQISSSGKGLGSFQQNLTNTISNSFAGKLLNLKKTSNIEVIDSHPTISADILNTEIAQAIYDEFQNIFPDNGSPIIKVYLVDNPQLKYGRKWDSDTVYVAHDQQLNGNEALIQLYINTDAVKKSKWSEQTVASQLEFDLLVSLNMLQDEIYKGFLSSNAENKTRMMQEQEQRSKDFINRFRSENTNQLFWASYD